MIHRNINSDLFVLYQYEKTMQPYPNHLYPFPFAGNHQFPGYVIQPFCISSFPIHFASPIFNVYANQANGISDPQPQEPPTKQGRAQSDGKTTCVSSKNQQKGIQTNSCRQPSRNQKRFAKNNLPRESDESQSQEFLVHKRNSNRKKNRIFKVLQNENRNIVPCMVQQVMAYVCKESKSGQVCRKVVQHVDNHSFDGAKGYYSFMRTIKSRQSHYVNIKSLRVLSPKHREEVHAFPEEQRKFYLKIARILARYYLQSRSFGHIYYSKKINTDKKEEQFKARRLILRILSELDE